MSNQNQPKKFTPQELQRMQNEMNPMHPDFQFAPFDGPMIDDEDVVELQAKWNGELADLTPQKLQNGLQFIRDFEPVANRVLKDWLKANPKSASAWQLKHMDSAELDWEILAEDSSKLEFVGSDYENDSFLIEVPIKFLFEPQEAIKEHQEEIARQEENAVQKKKAEQQAKEQRQQEAEYQKYLELKAKYENNHE